VKGHDPRRRAAEIGKIRLVNRYIGDILWRLQYEIVFLKADKPTSIYSRFLEMASLEMVTGNQRGFYTRVAGLYVSTGQNLKAAKLESICPNLTHLLLSLDETDALTQGVFILSTVTHLELESIAGNKEIQSIPRHFPNLVALTITSPTIDDPSNTPITLPTLFISPSVHPSFAGLRSILYKWKI
jgi:hypothetical protein